jgi:hypothetical protein
MEEIWNTVNALKENIRVSWNTLLLEANMDINEASRKWGEAFEEANKDYIQTINNILESANIDNNVNTHQITEICSRIAGFEGGITQLLLLPGQNGEAPVIQIIFSSPDRNQYIVLGCSLHNGFLIEHIVHTNENGERIINDQQATQEAQERINEIHAELGI